MKTINFKENNILFRNENVERYRIEMERYQPLNDGELRELIVKAQNGNERAKTKVINSNLRIVFSIAKAYTGMDVFEDILQNGNFGLCKAVDTFDVSRGTMFSTWALEMVRKYINEGLTNESRTIRMGAHLVKAKNNYNSVSMDAPLSSEDEDKKTLLDTFASDLKADNFSEIESMRCKINSLMKGLKPTEKQIVCALFGFGCREYTQYELSIKFNYTEERIRQIKFEALEKMKKLA